MSKHTFENDYGVEQECGDDGRVCEACWESEARHWAAHFGLTREMSHAQRVHQIAQFIILDESESPAC